MLLRVIDIETTGMEPPAEIIEFGRADVVSEGASWRIDRPMARLYKPLRGIPPETMAVHHITEFEFAADTPECTQELLHRAVWGGNRPDVLVAHNCEFERKFIPESATEGLPWICTLKAALRIWPDAPGHSNQVLRYWRTLVLDPTLAMPPHWAAPDAWVTANLLVEMLKMTSVDQLIAWTSEPKFFPNLTFGKHRGLPWAEVPLDYLQWMTGKQDMDPDVTWCAKRELERRRNSGAK